MTSIFESLNGSWKRTETDPNYEAYLTNMGQNWLGRKTMMSKWNSLLSFDNATSLPLIMTPDASISRQFELTRDEVKRDNFSILGIVNVPLHYRIYANQEAAQQAREQGLAQRNECKGQIMDIVAYYDEAGDALIVEDFIDSKYLVTERFELSPNKSTLISYNSSKVISSGSLANTVVKFARQWT